MPSKETADGSKKATSLGGRIKSRFKKGLGIGKKHSKSESLPSQDILDFLQTPSATQAYNFGAPEPTDASKSVIPKDESMDEMDSADKTLSLNVHRTTAASKTVSKDNYNQFKQAQPKNKPMDKIDRAYQTRSVNAKQSTDVSKDNYNQFKQAQPKNLNPSVANAMYSVAQARSWNESKVNIVTPNRASLSGAASPNSFSVVQSSQAQLGKDIKKSHSNLAAGKILDASPSTAGKSFVNKLAGPMPSENAVQDQAALKRAQYLKDNPQARHRGLLPPILSKSDSVQRPDSWSKTQAGKDKSGSGQVR